MILKAEAVRTFTTASFFVRYVPRALFLDLEQTVIDELKSGRVTFRIRDTNQNIQVDFKILPKGSFAEFFRVICNIRIVLAETGFQI